MTILTEIGGWAESCFMASTRAGNKVMFSYFNFSIAEFTEGLVHCHTLRGPVRNKPFSCRLE